MKTMIEMLEERRNARKMKSEKMALGSGVCSKKNTFKRKFDFSPSDNINIKHPKAKR